MFSWTIVISKNRHSTYRGFHEKGTLSYLCALMIDRQSPLNECTLQVPFIWIPLYVNCRLKYKDNFLLKWHIKKRIKIHLKLLYSDLNSDEWFCQNKEEKILSILISLKAFDLIYIVMYVLRKKGKTKKQFNISSVDDSEIITPQKSKVDTL